MGDYCDLAPSHQYSKPSSRPVHQRDPRQKYRGAKIQGSQATRIRIINFESRLVWDCVNVVNDMGEQC